MKKILAALRGRNGFSLLEVLMVVTVIAVIMAIISPNIASIGNKSKERADMASAACIGRALELYAAEKNIAENTDFTEQELHDALVVNGYINRISAPKSGGAWTARYTDKKVTVMAGEAELYPEDKTQKQ